MSALIIPNISVIGVTEFVEDSSTLLSSGAYGLLTEVWLGETSAVALVSSSFEV